MNTEMEINVISDDWDYDAIEEAAYDEECYCSYDTDGSVNEWCDICMFGERRAAYYKMRETAEEKHTERLEAIKNTLITNELTYRVRCIEEEEDTAKKVDMIQSMLRYLWDKQSYLSQHSGFLAVLRQKCDEWMADPTSASIQGTIIMTLVILSNV